MLKRVHFTDFSVADSLIFPFRGAADLGLLSNKIERFVYGIVLYYIRPETDSMKPMLKFTKSEAQVFFLGGLYVLHIEPTDVNMSFG